MVSKKKDGVKITRSGEIDEEHIDLVTGKGHNRVGGVAVEQLKSIIARCETLEEEKSGIVGDIRDVMSEAKGNGFDVKAIREILKLRKIDAQDREEQDAIRTRYLHALGMLPEFEPAGDQFD